MPATGFLVQEAYRWRNNDGNETTATWRQIINVADTCQIGNIIRLRFLIRETASVLATISGASTPLQQSIGGGAYSTITTGSLSGFRLIASGLVADNAVTTEQMAGPGAFTAGRFDSNGTWSVGLSGNDTEVEFCLEALTADTVNLRLANMNTYTNTASTTISTASVGNPWYYYQLLGR